VTIDFQTSYTLDLLHFIDLLITGGAAEVSDDLEHFRGFLSHEGDLSIAHLQKTLKFGQSLQQLVAPLLLADAEFNKLSLPELLISGRYLVNNYKSTPAYQKATLAYQRFLQKEALSVIASLEPLVLDMEKGGFKHYWFTTHLPMLNMCVGAYKERFEWDKFTAILGKWGSGTFQIYVSPLAKLDLAQYGINHIVVTYEPSCRRIARQLIEAVVEEAIGSVSWGQLVGRITQKEEIRKVKFWGQTVVDYVRKNARLALELLLKEEAGLIHNASQQLLNMEMGSYQLAQLIYEDMRQSPKNQQSMAEYLGRLFEHADLDGLKDLGKLKVA